MSIFNTIKKTLITTAVIGLFSTSAFASTETDAQAYNQDLSADIEAKLEVFKRNQSRMINQLAEQLNHKVDQRSEDFVATQGMKLEVVVKITNASNQGLTDSTVRF